MRIAFLGTSAFAVPALEALVEAGHEVVCVYTRAPKPSGRGQRERRSPVHETADALRLSVRTPKTLRNEEEAAAFRALDLDAAVVVSYGHILPRSFLEAPVLGCINIHGSLLPRWRGAAPIHRALLAGDAETGVTTMRMDEGLDTGPMLLAERTPISAADTAQTVHDRLARLGATLIVSTLDGLMRKTIEPVPQPEEGVTYAHKLAREEGLLDWRRPAAELERKVRAFAPWPGTSFDAPHEGGVERIKVLQAGLALASGAPGTLSIGRDGFPVVACNNGGLRLLKLQRPGKAAQAADAFLRGFPLSAGTVLPSPNVVPLPQTKPG
ncbi:methionyl-tRNA formyltransferase [Enhydrobacter sp.]|jgi:methionyl-tRNA formyltransferase|uniref:methionyl-tRNA formyltransferase n=1 Tax=Enhydrobacter sp. TaxID=1894999 RepID=UPI0026112222|nr:methionyl-tRNA formyltransferase [Enhydrobacter sp.]WIM12012.1 MAG: Methionyl-tRNA formyltransferase [Enhydrobacter sp.]